MVPWARGLAPAVEGCGGYLWIGCLDPTMWITVNSDRPDTLITTSACDMGGIQNSVGKSNRERLLQAVCEMQSSQLWV